MPAGMVPRAVRFLTHDLWRIRSRRLSRGRGFLLRLLRVVILAARGFRDDKCNLRASALTFYSLLSIVPVVAMAFGISKGFPGLKSELEEQLRKKIPTTGLVAEEKAARPQPKEGPGGSSFEPLEEGDGPTISGPGKAGGGEGAPPDAKAPPRNEIAERIISYADQLLDNTRGDWVAGIGILLLFYTVIKVLGQIEHSFNDIWGIKRHRSLGRKLADYFVVMALGPVLFMISSSLTVVVSTKIEDLLGRMEFVGPVVHVLLEALPWALVWLLFTFVYVFMPNTKVKFSAALIAGVVAGTTYQLVQWAYITFQWGVAKYNTIYGSLAALPLFLIWLQLSWLVVLFGAEISFAWQNVDTYEFEPDCLNVSQRFRRLLALRVAHLLVKNFEKEERPLTASSISHKLEIPIRLVNELLFELAGAGVISEARPEGTAEETYQLAKPPERFTVKSVLDAVEGRGTEDIPVGRGPELRKLSQSLEKFAELAEGSEANLALKDI